MTVVIGVAVALAAGFAFLVWISNAWIQVTTYEVWSSRIPPPFDRYCIVQVADLHGRRFGTGQERLVRAVRREQPDLIVVTGDLVSAGKAEIASSLELIRRLEGAVPVYFVVGNHEIHSQNLDDLLVSLAGYAVRVLRNRTEVIERDGQVIVIGGVDDPLAFGDFPARMGTVNDGWAQALSRIGAEVPRSAFTILLSHRPEAFTEYVRLGFDLVLSGHTHGGQVRFPILGALWVPDQGLLPRYVSGRYERGGTTMIVSRGLGSVPFTLRFLNRPELVVVRLRNRTRRDL